MYIIRCDVSKFEIAEVPEVVRGLSSNYPK